MDIVRMQAIASAYAALPSGPVATDLAQRSYETFAAEVEDQFASLPVRVEWWDRPGQPYANSKELFADLDDNGRMFVYVGGEDHPFLTREQNNKFRAVHDYFGHYAGGRNQFGPKGEFRAWQAHARMFSELAKHALTAETLGQNAWVNYGPHSHLPAADRPFAEQKANVLPAELWSDLQTVSV